MTLDEAIEVLGAPGDALPDAVMELVIDQWEQAGPRCLAMLDDYIHGRDLSEATERALFFVVHLLGEKSETAAFANLCALAGDTERADLVLGDAVTATLPKILISTFDGDAAPLQALVAREEVDSSIRDGALMALAYLTRAGRLPAAEMHAYFAGLFATMQPQSRDIVWSGLVMAVGMLGYANLTPQVEAVFARGLADPEGTTIKDFREDLRRAVQNPGSLDELAAVSVAPMGRAVDELAGPPPPQEPIINPLRAVGRNDPCPCGSGKKYKKCCLV